jgi:signal transduction histidine kinase
MDHDQPRLMAPGSAVEGYAWQSMTEDNAGAIWFAAREGLFRINGSEVRAFGLTGSSGLPVTIYFASSQLYLGTTTGLYTLNCASAACQATPIPGVTGPVVEVQATSDAALWAATWGNGIFRYDGRRVEQLSTRDGLADDFVRVLREDTEHNFWAGTRSGGLTRFRRTVLKPFGIPEGLGGNYASAVTGDGAGGLWLGTWRSGLFHWSNGAMTHQALPGEPLAMLIQSLAIDAGRTLWIGTFHGLFTVRRGSSMGERVPAPGPDTTITSILAARDHSLWLAKERAGLMIFPSGDPRSSDPKLLLDGETITALVEDQNNEVWIGTKSGLWRMSNGPDYRLESVAHNPVLAMARDRQGRIWVAQKGNDIRIYSAGTSIQFRYAGLPASSVYIIASDAKDGIWFGTGRGLARASMRDVEAFLSGALPRVELVAHGIPEGMRTIECRIGAQPSSWMTKDGSVWLPSARGFVEIEAQPTDSLGPPKPWIVRVQVDGKTVAAADRIHLSAGAHELAIGFTAIRLGRAERVQFRYRMQGLDQNWVETGNERVARYTQLRAGGYRLLVSARDPGGEWSEPVASATIEQMPFFYQTLWFRGLLAAALAVLAATVYRLRVHAIRRRYSAVLEERNRIAREWHDTLLAGLSAAAWQLDVVAEKCRDTLHGPGIQNALGMVRYCRDEARRAVGDLRHEEVNGNLADSVRETVRQQTGDAIRSRVEVAGKLPSCNSRLNSDLLRICQEATANAMQHAQASELVVRVDYRKGKISLSVQDDGIGMDASSLDHPPEGHYGLLGMRERVERVGGRLYISSQPGRGTQVKAVVPVQ